MVASCIGAQRGVEAARRRCFTQGQRQAQRGLQLARRKLTCHAEQGQTSAMQLPVVDLSAALHSGTGDVAHHTVLQSLRDTGCVVVRDPRVPSDNNDAFLDMMEQYFARPREQKMADCRPEAHYQVQAALERAFCSRFTD